MMNMDLSKIFVVSWKENACQPVFLLIICGRFFVVHNKLDKF